MNTVALYMRVSTDDVRQTVANQRDELVQTCERHGWPIAGEYVDHGIPGSKGRDQRPEG